MKSSDATNLSEGTTAPSPSNAISARGVRRSYGTASSAVVALNGADLTVARGEVIAVTGPSGSGKTTLLNCLVGLDTPDDGSIDVLGTDVRALEYEEAVAWRRDNIAVMFQSGGLLPYLTASENVDVALRLRRVGRSDRREATASSLRRLGLAEHADRRPGELSGGQRQRVGLAQGLAVAPKLFVADEPTGQLDTDTTLIVLQELRRVVDESELTIIMTTHDPVVEAFADRTVRLVDGIVVSGEDS